MACGRSRHATRVGSAWVSWLPAPPLSTSRAEPVQTLPRVSSNWMRPSVAVWSAAAAQRAGAKAIVVASSPTNAPASAQPQGA